MIRAAAVAALAACLLAAAAPAGAQELALMASSVQRCLTPAEDVRAKPVYPEEELKLKHWATVEAEFVFSAPDRAPTVVFGDDEGSPAYREAVQAYAKQLRVPCMSPGADPVKLHQAFHFVPNDGRKVAWTTATDEADVARSKTLACIKKPKSDEWISYPEDMLRAAKEGIVVATLHFTDAAKPPVAEILYDGGHRHFASAIGGYVDHTRLPCMGDGPVDVLFSFRFLLEGHQQRVLKDVDLPQYLRVVKPILPGSAFFDTQTMKCPFDVRLHFMQPFGANAVEELEELEEDVAARHAFLDWLGKLQVDLGPKPAAELVQQRMTIHVPCVKIDL